MSCNIKPAVSERSRLSVSSAVLARRAAHLCLLNKTCSTLPRENTLCLVPDFLYFVWLHFCQALCLSFTFAFIVFHFASLLFSKSNTAPCPVSKPALPLWLWFSSLFRTWLITHTGVRPPHWLKPVSQRCERSAKHYIADKVNKLGFCGRNLRNSADGAPTQTGTHTLGGNGRWVVGVCCMSLQFHRFNVF